MQWITRAGFNRFVTIAAAVAFVGALASGSTQAANGSVIYTYDVLGRLITASYDTGACIAYSYDANGNRLSETILVISSASTGVWGCFNWNSAKWGS